MCVIHGRAQKQTLTYERDDFWATTSNKQLNKDESLEDTENLPDPDVLAAEIVENLEAALEQFRSIAEELEETD